MTEKRDVVIWGAGIQGEIVAYILSYDTNVNIRAFVDDDPDLIGNELKGVPVLKPDTATLKRLREDGASHGIVAIGNSGWVREKLSKRLEQMGYQITNAIHPTAHISPGALLGQGIIVDSLCNFGFNPQIGNYVLASISATVGHDSRIGDNVELCAGCVISSKIHISKNVHVGTGATIVSKNFGSLSVGEGAQIGVGALVLEDVPAKAVVVGSPARIVRYRQVDD